jgi:hypothetical protein
VAVCCYSRRRWIGLAIVTRLISVAVLTTLVHWKQLPKFRGIAVLTWGGLRGGISVALALTLGPSPIGISWSPSAMLLWSLPSWSRDYRCHCWYGASPLARPRAPILQQLRHDDRHQLRILGPVDG